MRDPSELAETTERVLRKYGLDPCEGSVLDTARLESPAPRDLFASFARDLAGGDTHAPFTLERYEEALERLLLKGLLCVVTPAEIAEESARNEQAGIPEVRAKEYDQPGNVDFTQTGFDVNRNVLRELWGDQILKTRWAGWKIDVAAQRLDVYGLTAEDCQERMDRFLEPPQHQFGKSERRYSIAQRPSPIGAWSPKRFVVLPSGFHGVLTYTVEPRRG
jgi:hypothetical protein